MAKKTRRSKVKNAALVKKYNSKIRQEYLDQDYLDQLNPEELKWLNDFMAEYNNASVGKQKDKGKNNRFHKSKKLVKDCTDRNNARNRCIHGLAKAGYVLDSVPSYELSDYIDDIEKIHKTEDVLNELIDLKREYLGKSEDDPDDQ